MLYECLICLLYSIIFFLSNLNKTLTVLTEKLILFEYRLKNGIETLNNNKHIMFIIKITTTKDMLIC